MVAYIKNLKSVQAMDNNLSPTGEDTRKKKKSKLILDNAQHDIKADQAEKLNKKEKKIGEK